MKIRNLFFLSLILVFVGAGCEHEGYLNVSDCRESIPVSEDSPWNYIHDFSCTYQKNSRGEIYSGLCCRTDTAAFTDKCLRAYCYTKGSEVSCGENEQEGVGGDCYCKLGYTRTNSGCVPSGNSANTNQTADDGAWIVGFWVIIAIGVYWYVKRQNKKDKTKKTQDEKKETQ